MAFDTPIIDSGVGADENPLAGSWARMLTILAPLKRASNVFAHTVAGNINGSYRPGTVYAADCEFYVRMASITGGANQEGWLYMRLQGGGGDGTGFNGYAFSFTTDGAGVAACTAYSMTNAGTATLYAASGIPAAWLDGDYVGFRCIGTSIQTWCKPASTGVWVQTGSANDSTYTAGGTVALGITGSALTLNQFGGGNVIGAEKQSVYVARRRSTR